MTTARDTIFASIRRSLGVNGSERLRAHSVDERLERAPKGIIPARGQLPKDGQIALFRAQAEAALASVVEVEGPDAVPGAVAEYLRSQNAAATIRFGSDPLLNAMPWGKTALEVSKGRSFGDDLNAVSHAIAGVAETGTLVLASGPGNPTTLNFLPDNHIVIIEADDICGDYESMWQIIRRTYGKGEMPRTVNMVTGPSRSADIEQTLLLGAHGPRSLHIVIIRE